jgi:ADP-heptose:LPS heptosyltransferase
MKINRIYPYTKTIVKNIFKSIDYLLDLFPKKSKVISKEVNNILLIKPDHLGDVVLFSSVLKPLKEKFPNSYIDVVIGSWSNEILNNNPYIRNIYNIDHYKHNRSSKNILIKLKIFFMTYLNVLKLIRKNSYDVSLNFRSYGANLVTLQLFSNSKFSVGFATSGFSPLLDFEVDFIDNKHEVEYFLDILKVLEINKEIEEVKSEIYSTKEDRFFVDKIIKQYNLDEFIIIHPGSGDKQKMKDNKFWQALISKRGERIVFCGAENEKYLIKEVNTRDSIDLMGKFSISQLMEFYKKAIFIYTVDSLAGHIASMTDTNTVSFYSEFTDTRRWKPIGKNVKVVKEHEKYLDNLI